MDRNKNVRICLGLLLVCIATAAFYLMLQGRYLFASDIDWLMQHSVFPDYFRKLFYETGEWYPDFAPSIGGGQNIYNFAYYGLLNPCILLSYAFPWIPMYAWMMGVGAVSFLSSVLLFYRWISRKKLEPKVCISVTLLFMLASPLLYHSYVQVMFVNYMPFLCLALMGTDRYFEKRKAGLLIVGAWMMIMTSFYFSIGGFLCLCLYALYSYLDRTERVQVWSMLLEAVRYVAVLLTSVLLSGFFLAPTAMALVSGRGGKAQSVENLLELLLPFGDPVRLLYNNYGTGVTMLALFALVAGIAQKKVSRRVLHISLLVVLMIPFVSYALNGFLYNREKVLIPFLPLFCFAMALWLQSLKERKTIPGETYIVSVLLLIYVLTASRMKEMCILGVADLLLVLGSICVYFKRKRANILIVTVPAIVLSLCVGAVGNQMMASAMDEKELSLEEDQEVAQLMTQIKEKDRADYRMEYYDTVTANTRNLNRIFVAQQKMTSVYSSTYNASYDEFREKIFHVEKANRNTLMEGLTENPIFRNVMGVRYLVSKKPVPGYKKVLSGKNMDVYQNPNAFDMAYGTSDTVSDQAYQELSFPYNQLVFQNYAVASDGRRDGHVVREELSRKVIEVKDQSAFEGKLEGTKKIQIPKTDEDAILFVRFHVKNHTRGQDMSIRIGDSQNKLSASHYIYYNENETFTYAVPIEEGQKEELVTFSKGHYEVTDIEMYLAPLQAKKKENQYTFIQDTKEKRTSHVLDGKIVMGENGYLITSIPYDEQFQIVVDGKETKLEKENQGFVGCRLSKGSHHVWVIYKASGKKAGCLLSALGLLILLCCKIRSCFGKSGKCDPLNRKKSF